jgi:hypothetical protein
MRGTGRYGGYVNNVRKAQRTAAVGAFWFLIAAIMVIIAAVAAGYLIVLGLHLDAL